MDRHILTDQEKQNISKVIDKQFIADIFNSRLGQYYADFARLSEIKSKIYKKYIGSTRAFFVAGYDIGYSTKQGDKKNLTIFVSAHTDGSRKLASISAQRLYDNGFSKGPYQVTRPLFYLDKQNAFFYEASAGSSFLKYIHKDPKQDMTAIFKLSAGWIKHLHTSGLEDKFEWRKFSVKDISPLPRLFSDDFFLKYPENGELVEWLFGEMQNLQGQYDKKIDSVVIYGDYHPENIIVSSLQADSIKMIDFTDVCLGNPMVDIGVFLQQLEFMTHHQYSDVEVDALKKSFLENYFGQKFEHIDIKYINAINLYQSWTALRSATFLFYMKNLGSAVAPVLEQSKLLLQLSKSSTRQITTFLL